jgi:glycosyltransferase involved in cell wall biosynthesis
LLHNHRDGLVGNDHRAQAAQTAVLARTTAMTNPGVVSVVVPCFNGAAFVDDALWSIRNQTYASLEVIAVNDGSTDDTQRILETHARADQRVRVVSQPNRGLSAARNTGIRHAEGEFLCFLDADDVMLPEKLEKQVYFLQQHPQVDLVYSDYFIGDPHLDPVGLVAVRIPETDLVDAYACRNWFGAMAPLVRTHLIRKVGEFDERLRASEDWDYWIRCAQAGGFGYLPGIHAIYRRHPAEMHKDHRRMFASGKQVIEKHFRSDRRRYRFALASFYFLNAKYRWADHDRLKACLYLALSEFNGRIAGRDPKAWLLKIPY